MSTTEHVESRAQATPASEAAPQQKSRLGNDLYTGKRSLPFVQKRNLWFLIAGALILVSMLVLAVRGINPGIEFRGGSEFLISGAANPTEQTAHDAVSEVDTDQVARVSRVGSDSVRVQTEELSNEQTTAVQQNLAEAYGVEPNDVTATYIGPTWGADVSQKAITSLVVFLGLVTLVMALYFRTVKMAIGGIIAVLHDVLLTVGVYALTGWEVTPATVIGFLTILGYSLYDTVVVFDKVRENTANLYRQDRYTYEEAANLGVNQTLVRSVHTSVTGLLPVGSILIVGVFLLGAGSLRDIALALFVGMLLSTVSSVFIATPAVVALVARDPKVKEHTEMVLAKRRSEAGVTEAEIASDIAAQRAPDSAADEAYSVPGSEPRSDELFGAQARGHHQGHGAQPRRQPKGKR